MKTILFFLGMALAFLATQINATQVISEGKEGYFPAYAVDAVDTTGAGDAFNGGLAYGLATGRSAEESIKFASKVAALSVTKIGVVPGLPKMQDIEEYFKEVW